MGYVDKLIGWIGRHKTLSALGIASLFGLGLYATNDYAKDKVYSGAKWAKDKVFSKSNSKAVVGAPVAVVVANASAVATPQVSETPAPKFDYYDEDLKVGVEYIEPSIKTNVTNLIRTWKDVTPDDYKDKFPYTPKRIIRSHNNNFNYYGGAPDDDFIKISEVTEKRGGSDNSEERVAGVVDIEPEFRNAKQSKTGVKFSSGYESELDANIWKAKYAVRVGVWTQTQADAFVENVSKRINPNGSYKK